ncbi:MAG: Gfo/Idh/MocA family protein [Phycisphaerales bacterium JB063]
MHHLTRRDFVKTSGLALGAMGIAPSASALQGTQDTAPETLRVLSIGVQGMGHLDRTQVNSHPRAQIVGLCDVDTAHLEQAGQDHPDAFKDTDYRRVFADRADEFDAVIVSVPDHSHAPMMLTALAHGKHCYGQKPLVHQLEELTMIERAMAVRPGLVTQVGNQRMVERGRRAAVEILRQRQLGPTIEAWVWTGSVQGRFTPGEKGPTKDKPAHLDWDLWLGPCEAVPYRDGMAHFDWRSWWDYGTAGLGDWGVHVLDIIFYAYDDLSSPISVITHTPRAADWYHTAHCQSTITYAVDSDNFARDRFPIHYSDSGLAPSRASLGIPGDRWPDSNMTVVVCEEGVLALTAGGGLEIWRGGEMTEGWRMPDLPEMPHLNHWHAWVDNTLGIDTELRTPFLDGVRITEPALLAAKASRFPGTELRWDKSNLTFTGHQEATDTLVKREYRDGFAPPALE